VSRWRKTATKKKRHRNVCERVFVPLSHLFFSTLFALLYFFHSQNVVENIFHALKIMNEMCYFHLVILTEVFLYVILFSLGASFPLFFCVFFLLLAILGDHKPTNERKDGIKMEKKIVTS
jgi:hypothetical protein